ncbi:MAG: hypothetical protein B7Z37_26080, partial [Verrucomicrobia bacterium 12-59-8]
MTRFMAWDVVVAFFARRSVCLTRAFATFFGLRIYSFVIFHSLLPTRLATALLDPGAVAFACDVAALQATGAGAGLAADFFA